MAAHEHLSKPLFHGTGSLIPDDENIVPNPQQTLDGWAVDGFVRKPAAFAATDHNDAASYARSRAAHEGRLFGVTYEVTPVDPTESHHGREYPTLAPGFAHYDNSPGYISSHVGFSKKRIASYPLNENIWLENETRKLKKSTK